MENITVHCQTEYLEYVYNERQDVTAIVTLKAPLLEEDEQEEEKRAPIDLVAVIDKSGSMAGEKLKLVKTTLEFIISQLRSKDRLALVTYDSNVYIDFGFKIMNKDNKADCLAKVKNIMEGSMTNLSGGLLQGLSLVVDRSADGKNEVASVLLLTDGLANEGITSEKGIVAAMKDPTRMRGIATPTPGHAPQKRKSKARKAIPAAEIEPVPEPVSSGGPADATVYTFGFGADHDPVLLKAISDAGSGMYYFIEKEEQIAESFGHCLGGLLSTVAQGIQMELTFEGNATFTKIHTARPKTDLDDKTVKIDMGDLQSEENRDIVIELMLDHVHAPYETTPQNLMNVKVDYYNVITSQLATAHANLGVLRPERVERKKEDVNIAVVKQRTRIQLAEDMQKAEKKAKEGNYAEAKEILKMRKAAIESDELIYADGGGEEYQMWKQDLDSMEDVYNPRDYVSKGKHMASNICQMHEQQRSSGLESKSYVTKKKASKRFAAKKFMEEE